MTLRYYLADNLNRVCLAANGQMKSLNVCQPWYFESELEAMGHPASRGLKVFSCILQYYLADPHDRIRLATTGQIEAANDCQPWYFTSEHAALSHPAARGLMVHSCPVAETIPGLPKGAVCAEDVLARLDPYALGSIAQEVAKLCNR